MKKFYLPHYIIIGLSVILIPLSGMNPETQIVPIPKETHIFEKMWNSCDLMNNRTLSSETINVSKKSYNRNLKKLSLEEIPKVLEMVNNCNVNSLSKTQLQESLTNELIKKQEQESKNLAFNKKITPLKTFLSQHKIKQDELKLISLKENNSPLLIELNSEAPKTKKLSLDVISLCKTLQYMISDCNNEEQFIELSIKTNINKASSIFFKLLKQCVLINNEKTQETINLLAEKINETIENLDLPMLTNVLILAHYYDVETTYNGKEVILRKSLTSMFLKRIEALPFDLRSGYINKLDSNLHNDLLYEFVTQKELAKLLKEKYIILKKESGCTEYLRPDNSIDSVFYFDKIKNSAIKKLTLHQAMLTYDIITEKGLYRFLRITEDMVSEPIQNILLTCNELGEIIEKNKAKSIKEAEEAAILKKIKAENEKDIVEQQKMDRSKPQSLTEKLKRYFTFKNLLRAGIVAYCTCFIYILCQQKSVQNYFSPAR